MSRSMPLCTPTDGGGVELYYRGGRSISVEALSRGVVLSNRMVFVITGRGGGAFGRRYDRWLMELLYRNHPGPYENLEISHTILPGRMHLVAVIDRQLLGEIRKCVGDRVPLMLPVPRGTIEIPHPDGGRERISLTQKDGYQFRYIVGSGVNGVALREASRRELWEVFLGRKRKRRRRRIVASLLGVVLLTSGVVGFLPWAPVGRLKSDYSRIETAVVGVTSGRMSPDDRLRAIQEEYGYLLAIKKMVPPSPTRLLGEIYTVSPGGVGVEELTMDETGFHLVVWTEQPEELIHGMESGGSVSVVSVVERELGEDARGTNLRRLSISGRFE